MDYHALIQKSLGHIDEVISERISIHDLACFSYFSKYHFQRIFRAIVGDSVMDYVKKRRLSLAGRELCETANTVLDIALKYGYQSAESFSRAFKAYHGITPTQCRRHHICKSFEHNISQGGVPEMRETKSMLKNTEEAKSTFNDLIVKVDQTAAEFLNVSRELRLGNFEVIAQELTYLSGRVRGACEEIGRPAENSEEFSAINRCFAIIKVIEDIAFQTHIIQFFTEIQVARTALPKREKLSQAAAQCDGLAHAAREKALHIQEIFSELAAMINEDIQKQCEVKISTISNLCREACERVLDVSSMIHRLDDALPDGSFRVIRTTLDQIADGIAKAADVLSGTERENTDMVEERARWIETKLEDDALLLNVICLNAKLDVCRTPDADSVRQITDALMILPAALFDIIKSCRESREEFISLCALSRKKPEPDLPARKMLEDIAYQGTIMIYALRSESEKLQFFAPTDVITLLWELADRVDHALCRIAQPRDLVKEELKVFGESLEEVVPLLRREGETLADKGGVLIFFANEFDKLVRASRRVEIRETKAIV